MKTVKVICGNPATQAIRINGTIVLFDNGVAYVSEDIADRLLRMDTMSSTKSKKKSKKEKVVEYEEAVNLEEEAEPEGITGGKREILLKTGDDSKWQS